ncbi:LysE family transporter [Bizionia hallyeonensis]|uniref:LysE family transporter n=1 Tax=Bizionia hallyeonensis TaxID=1123757 RepID=A0ABW0C3W7_9FLAO
MNITLVFFISFLTTFLATLPPGLLNMTAAKISLKENLTRGIMFSLGACLIIIFQALIATVFARYLSNHPDVIEILRIVALIIFAIISVYFLFIAKCTEKEKKDVDVRSKTSRFFHGMFLSSINVFPIPFQAYVAISLASFGVLEFHNIGIASYVLGASSGAFVALYIYMIFFDKIKDRKIASQKSMNYLIGIITGLVAIVTLFNILKDL